MSARRTYDPEFNAGAVRIVVESGKPIAQVIDNRTLGGLVGALVAGRDRLGHRTPLANR